MASNFTILVHRNSENVHLKLVGDFDDFSAHQLVSALKEHCSGAHMVFIHTSGLKDIFPFFRETFHKDLQNLNSIFFGNLIFTGDHAKKIAPKHSQIL